MTERPCERPLPAAEAARPVAESGGRIGAVTTIEEAQRLSRKVVSCLIRHCMRSPANARAIAVAESGSRSGAGTPLRDAADHLTDFDPPPAQIKQAGGRGVHAQTTLREATGEGSSEATKAAEGDSRFMHETTLKGAAGERRSDAERGGRAGAGTLEEATGESPRRERHARDHVKWSPIREFTARVDTDRLGQSFRRRNDLVTDNVGRIVAGSGSVWIARLRLPH